jgi:hypothetical protein
MSDIWGGHIGVRHQVRRQSSRWPSHCMISNSLRSFGSAIQERLVAAVHRLAADGYGKRDKGRPKSVLCTRCSANLSKAASPVVYGISGRCSAARPPCLRPPSPLYLLSASGDLGIPDWELRARRKPRMRKQSDGAYGIRFAERQSAASPR